MEISKIEINDLYNYKIGIKYSQNETHEVFFITYEEALNIAKKYKNNLEKKYYVLINDIYYELFLLRDGDYNSFILVQTELEPNKNDIVDTAYII